MGKYDDIRPLFEGWLELGEEVRLSRGLPVSYIEFAKRYGPDTSTLRKWRRAVERGEGVGADREFVGLVVPDEVVEEVGVEQGDGSFGDALLAGFWEWERQFRSARSLQDKKIAYEMMTKPEVRRAVAEAEEAQRELLVGLPLVEKLDLLWGSVVFRRAVVGKIVGEGGSVSGVDLGDDVDVDG